MVSRPNPPVPLLRCGGSMRLRLSLAFYLGLFIAVPLIALPLGAGDKKLVLKVLVPEGDAETTVNRKSIEGKCTERKIEVGSPPKGQKFHIVVGSWEPNNYTKFTRTRKVPIDSKGPVTVDLTKAYDVEKIKIRWVPTPEDVVA